MFLIFMGMVAISLALSYAWWCRIRVINLRQDIYDLRDSLFDAAVELEVLDDPAYQATRLHFNSIAKYADAITLPVLAYVYHLGLPENVRLKSKNPLLQQKIDATIDICAERLKGYLLRETFTGRVVLPLMRLARVGTVLEVLAKRWLVRLVASDAPERFTRTQTT